jgi:NADPH:quinone reductase-like Zn-dependent oxidoreductase
MRTAEWISYAGAANRRSSSDSDLRCGNSSRTLGLSRSVARERMRPIVIAPSSPTGSKADMAALFDLLREGAIDPVVVDRLPIAAARGVHDRIDAGGLGGKIVLLPWPEPE